MHVVVDENCAIKTKKKKEKKSTTNEEQHKHKANNTQYKKKNQKHVCKISRVLSMHWIHQ